MRQDLKRVAEAAGYAVDVTGLGPLFNIHFTSERVTSPRGAAYADRKVLAELHTRLFDYGIFSYHGHVGFISSAHSDNDIERTVATVNAVLEDMKGGQARRK